MNAYEFCPVLMSSSWTSFFSECLHQYPGIHFAYSCHCTSFFSFSSLSQKIIQFFPFPSYFQFFISDFTCLSLFVIRYSCLKYLHWLFWRYIFHWLIMFSHWMFFNFIDCSKFLLLCVSLLYLLKHCGSLTFFFHYYIHLLFQFSFIKSSLFVLLWTFQLILGHSLIPFSPFSIRLAEFSYCCEHFFVAYPGVFLRTVPSRNLLGFSVT